HTLPHYTTIIMLFLHDALPICILVSDFVYPSWFESFWPPNGAQFDYGNHIHSPFELVPGGYIGAFDVKCGTGWHQVTPPGQTFTDRKSTRLNSSHSIISYAVCC